MGEGIGQTGVEWIRLSQRSGCVSSVVWAEQNDGDSDIRHRVQLQKQQHTRATKGALVLTTETAQITALQAQQQTLETDYQTISKVCTALSQAIHPT